MASIGLRTVFIVATLFCTTPGAPAAEPSPAVADALAVQEAMRQGRDFLQRGQSKAAVESLEAQLARVKGNATYLALLRDAYHAYIKDLQLAHQDELCATYRKRLLVLEREAGAIAPPPTTARAAREDESPRGTDSTATAHVAAAERAFVARQYGEAQEQYGRAVAGGTTLSADQRKQWAYCRLHAVSARSEQPGAANAMLEQEIAAAVKAADNDPKLTAFGRQLLDRLRQRPGAAAAIVAIRHVERDNSGWERADAPSFRVHHVKQRELAEQVARAAEAARAAAFDRWAGPPARDWKPSCDVYLYATAADYAKATGQPAGSPGHATYKSQNGAVSARRLDLRADEPNLLAAVVPHETTHLVLGDLFPDVPLPRWADEGMAVLAEPRARIDRYARTLHACRQRGELVPLDKLLAKGDYPDSSKITVFYVESVSVVEYLVAANGPRAFVAFLRDAQRGMPAALQKHYQCATVAELQDRWLRKTFGAGDARASAGQ